MQIVVVGGRASGRTTIVAALIEALGESVKVTDMGDVQTVADEMRLVPVCQDIEEMSIRLSTIDRCMERLRADPPRVVLHLRTSPHRQHIAMRRRRLPEDDELRLGFLREQGKYLDAVVPQVSQRIGAFYFPVIVDKGVTYRDFLPELQRLLS
ncbi:hypothetical protein [Pseudomonas phage Achelous]|uniref:Uncharacterized protein n=1 Tax=Pseudomonas phage Achelous TaxID=2163982 RepID=A0A2S1GMU3_9CAUD|nr:hypothetical protein HOT10_gp22 [Pseudomonas phage Achelous]AWD90699.1 hypothetical protein [Pseudomonas phage Achelous]